MNEKTRSFLSGGILGLLTHHPENKNKKTSGLAIASLVLGIFSVLLGWIPFFGWILVILAILFGVLALININKGLNSGRGLAFAGFVLGIIGFILALILMISFIVSAFRGSSCEDMNCFIIQANQCNATTYQETIDVGTISYSVNSSCVLTKEIVKLSDKEDPLIKRMIERKTMECFYSKGKFNGQWTTSMIEGLQNCRGELKEAIGQMLILV